MKTLKLIRNIVLILIFVAAIIVAIMTLAGFVFEPCLPALDYPGEDGNLAVFSSTGSQIASIPLLGYVAYGLMTLAGKIIAGVVVFGLLATFIPFGRKVKKDKENSPAKIEGSDQKAVQAPAAPVEPQVKENAPDITATEELAAEAEDIAPEELIAVEPVVLDLTDLQAAEAVQPEISGSEIDEYATLPSAEEPASETESPAEEVVTEEAPAADTVQDTDADNADNEEIHTEEPETEKVKEMKMENTETKSFMDTLIINDGNNDSEEKVSELEAANRKQAEMISSLTDELDTQKKMLETKEEEYLVLRDKLTALGAEQERNKGELEKAKKVIKALNDKAGELTGMLEKSLGINEDISAQNEEKEKQLTAMQESVDKNNEQYDALYDRYSTLLDFLLRKNMASAEACEREKQAFGR